MTASALYVGEVRHRRHAGPERTFTHPVAFTYLDLDELPRLLGGRLVKRRPGLVRVRRRDLHGEGDVASAVRALVAERSGRPAADGPVRVLTTPRTLGVCFNPVSFYYCFDRDERLDAVVAEVTSTPWLQRHAYVLRPDPPGAVLRGEHDKELHVSPFQDMDHRHEWRVTEPRDTASVHIANHRTDDGATDFDATLRLERRALTPAAVRRLLVAPPGGALRTLALIYGHAVALKLRGATHFAPPTTSAT